jgi:hypothetical protein
VSEREEILVEQQERGDEPPHIIDSFIRSSSRTRHVTFRPVPHIMRYWHERGVKRPRCKDDPVLQQGRERVVVVVDRCFACLPATDDPIRSESTQRDALVSRSKTHPFRYFVLRKYYPVPTGMHISIYGRRFTNAHHQTGY